MKKKFGAMKCEGSGPNCAVIARGVWGRTNECVRQSLVTETSAVEACRLWRRDNSVGLVNI